MAEAMKGICVCSDAGATLGRTAVEPTGSQP